MVNGPILTACLALVRFYCLSVYFEARCKSLEDHVPTNLAEFVVWFRHTLSTNLTLRLHANDRCRLSYLFQSRFGLGKALRVYIYITCITKKYDDFSIN